MSKSVIFGDLEVSLTDQFNFRWNDRGSEGKYNGSYYHPSPLLTGFYPLGSYGKSGYGNPDNKVSVFVVKLKDTEEEPAVGKAICFPENYKKVWKDSGSGADRDGSFWRPVPPSGYVALGLVAQSGHNKPNT